MRVVRSTARAGRLFVRSRRGNTPLVRVPVKQRRYTSVRSQEVMQRAHEKALTAGQRMQVRLENALKQRKISREEYFRLRKAIEKKQMGLLGRIKAQSKRMSERDPMLNMLFNKEYMEKKMIPAFLSRHRKGSVVLLDIDHFRAINTKNGHEAGDVALRFLGIHLNTLAARRFGGYAGRIGGEEFAVVLPHGRKDAAAFIRSLNRALLDDFSTNGVVRSALGKELFTFSAGVGLASERKDWVSLKKLVDRRLYNSKNSGRNRVTYTGAVSRPIRKAA